MEQIQNKKNKRSFKDINNEKQKSVKEFFKQINIDRTKKLEKASNSTSITNLEAVNKKEKFLNKLIDRQKKQEQDEIDHKIFLEEIADEKREVRKTVKLSINGLAKNDSISIIKKIKSIEEQVTKEINEKRNKLKEISDTVLVKSNCKCQDIFAYVSPQGDYFTSCKFCSRLKKWAAQEWFLYNATNQGRPLNTV
jgi:hypothetical protein